MTVIRATVVVFLSALLSLSAFAESDLTMKTFGDRVIRELRETYSDRMYERLDAATINIIELDDKGRRSDAGTIFLDNVFEEYELAPEEIDSLISNFVTAIHAMDADDRSNLEERLVVMLRDREYPTLVPPNPDRPQVMVHHPFMGDLSIILFIDTPQAVSPVMEADLEEDGIERAEAFNLARRNLQTRFGEVIVENEDGFEFISSSNGLTLGYYFLDGICDVESGDWMSLILDRDTVLRVSVPTESDELSPALLEFLEIAPGAVMSGELGSNYIISCFGGSYTWMRPTTDDTDPAGPPEGDFVEDYISPFEDASAPD